MIVYKLRNKETGEFYCSYNYAIWTKKVQDQMIFTKKSKIQEVIDRYINITHWYQDKDTMKNAEIVEYELVEIKK